MDISYIGGTSFLLKGERTVAINPVAKAEEAHISLYSGRQKNRRLIVNGPGEYEIGGVLIATLAGGNVLIHAVELDGISIVHLPAGAGRLDERTLAAIGRVDVLLVEAADLRTAQTVVADLAPRVVIPFGPQAAELCAATGVKNAEPQARFAWNGITTPPKAVLLKTPAAKKRSGSQAA